METLAINMTTHGTAILIILLTLIALLFAGAVLATWWHKIGEDAERLQRETKAMQQVQEHEHMTRATSEYLNRPTRTIEQAERDLKRNRHGYPAAQSRALDGWGPQVDTWHPDEK